MTDIYLITNLVNGKQYVGQTRNGYINRFHRHCLAYSHGCRNYISCAINKYGKENFKTELIKQVDDSEWKYWETYYIKFYKTYYTQGGYNLTWGGDDNPMNNDQIKQKHFERCSSEEFKQKQRNHSLGKHHSEATKELCRQNTLANLDICVAGFRRYNESRKIKVGMIDESNEIIKTFDSLSDACKYLGVNDKSFTAHIKRYADKINKNGKRAKFLGYSWTLL